MAGKFGSSAGAVIADALVPPHLLLGLLAQPGLLADALAARGITLIGVLQAMDAGGAQEDGR